MLKAWAMPLIFLSLYLVPILGFSWLLTFWIRRRHPRWPAPLLMGFFTVLGLFLAPIPDRGDFELLGWKIWKTLRSQP